MSKLFNNSITTMIGSTPLVEVPDLFRGRALSVYAKLEMCNLSGSMKDRAAARMLSHGIESGEINEGTVVIESSSGNLGIALARACAYLGLRFICVVDSKATPMNVKIIQAYGAEIELVTDPEPSSQEYLPARINRVKELISKYPNSYWPNQYKNNNNPDAYENTLMPEVISQLGSEPDFIIGAVSTGGSIMGCARYCSSNNLKTKVIPVDVFGSCIFSPVKKDRVFPGIGAAFKTDFIDENLLEKCVFVAEEECVSGCMRLLKSEGILSGASSGAVVSGVEKIINDIPEKSSVVLIIPDRGERYLDSVYSAKWVEDNLTAKTKAVC